MAGTIRHKAESGWNFPAPVLTGNDIAIGDLLWQDGCYARPLDQLTSTSGESPLQKAAHIAFFGVSNDSVLGTELVDTNISVSAEGHYEYDTDALLVAACVGYLVGPSENPATGLLYNQQVEVVDLVSESIGVVIKAAAVGATRLHCRLWSTVMTGGGIQNVVT